MSPVERANEMNGKEIRYTSVNDWFKSCNFYRNVPLSLKYDPSNIIYLVPLKHKVCSQSSGRAGVSALFNRLALSMKSDRQKENNRASTKLGWANRRAKGVRNGGGLGGRRGREIPRKGGDEKEEDYRHVLAHRPPGFRRRASCAHTVSSGGI